MLVVIALRAPIVKPTRLWYSDCIHCIFPLYTYLPGKVTSVPTLLNPVYDVELSDGTSHQVDGDTISNIAIAEHLSDVDVLDEELDFSDASVTHTVLPSWLNVGDKVTYKHEGKYLKVRLSFTRNNAWEFFVVQYSWCGHALSPASKLCS